MESLSVLCSYIIALVRLPFLTVLFIVSSLQQVLFERCEVVNVEMKVVPLRCDRQKATDNVAYIDKLCYENPDLVEIADESDIIDDMDDGDEGLT